MNAFGVLVVLPAVATLLAVLYFRRVPVDRPPIGVYTLRDIAVMMTVVVLLPVLYLSLPDLAVATALGLMTVFAVQFTLAPLLSGRIALGAAVAAGAADVALVTADLTTPAVVWNNVLLLTLVIGVTNLYTQSGIRARDVAVFGMLLAGYDLVATTMLPTMGNLLRKTIELPFAPVFTAWTGPQPTMIGLGDVLMLTLWTLVSLKSYGRAAGWVAAGTALALTTGLALAIRTGLLTGLLPVMLAAGPLMAMQYLLWRSLRGPERTTASYHGLTTADATTPSTETMTQHLTTQIRKLEPNRQPETRTLTPNEGR
jgi:hypothetical protein